jgi:hypothetical protein
MVMLVEMHNQEVQMHYIWQQEEVVVQGRLEELALLQPLLMQQEMVAMECKSTLMAEICIGVEVEEVLFSNGVLIKVEMVV